MREKSPSKNTKKITEPPARVCGEREIKMTKREVMNAILKAEVAEEIKEFAKNELEKMDRANAKRASKPTKAYIENTPLVEKIYEEILTEEPKFREDIAEELGVTPGKVGALMKRVIAEGKGKKVEVKVKGKGKKVGYIHNLEQ